MKAYFFIDIVPLHIYIIIKKVLPSVVRERRINPNGEKGKLAPKFFELCYAYQNATSDEQKEATLKTLNDWIIETYQSQEDASFQDASGRF